MSDLFWREKLANSFCEQRCISSDDPRRALILDAFCTGASMTKPAEQQDESWQAGYDKGRQDGANRRPDDVKQLEARNAELEARNALLENQMHQIATEVECNIRSFTRDLVNRAAGLNNGANPNDLYGYCDRIDAIIDEALQQEATQ